MPTMIIKAYDVVINCDWLGNGTSILIGVAEEGHPDGAYFDSWADEKIYYYLTSDEFEDLKIGDVLNDGEDFTIVNIDKNEPYYFFVEYEMEEVCE